MPPAPTTPPRPARPRAGLARFDTLRVKLFLAIAGANMLFVLAAYAIHAWSFDKGLVAYLNQADEARLQPLVQRLGEGHRQNGGWGWIVGDRLRWFEDEKGPPVTYIAGLGPGFCRLYLALITAALYVPLVRFSRKRLVKNYKPTEKKIKDDLF